MKNTDAVNGRATSLKVGKPSTKLPREIDTEIPTAVAKRLEAKAKKCGVSVVQYLIGLVHRDMQSAEYLEAMESSQNQLKEFSEWLKQVPHLGPTGTNRVPADLKVSLCMGTWSLLIQAAAHFKTDVANVIAYYVTCHRGGIPEWGNGQFGTEEAWNWD